ncbi:hypothetical protein AMS68_004614 [Peltaster fructicola]|uniref:Xylanolytic transcriptional activator regulatory domain-containing protein n=1 Tax=Peltaster fructicola TaxID=286661 RepID=A0A6H0XWF8_9PEZI|nr:hypothetical protein AMS68_004614 [Peltaster fructicola]
MSEDAEESAQQHRSPSPAAHGTLESACETCKQRKVWQCEYRARKKPGLRAGYGRELESRLSQLEGILLSQQNVLQRLANHLPSTTPSNDAEPGATIVDQTLVQSTVTNNNDVSPVDATSQVPYEHSSSSMTIGQPPNTSPLSTTGHPVPQHAASRAVMTFDAIVPQVNEDSLLSADILYALTQLFLVHINPWFPVLHDASILDDLFGSRRLENGDKILLHAITATALKYSTDQRLTETIRQQVYTIAKQRVLLYGMENMSVRSLQAMTILALDIVGGANGPPGWNMLALITRNAVQLGLSVEQTSSVISPRTPSIYTLRAFVLPKPASFLEDESRRRLFWVIYMLDRLTTLATAFDFSISDKDIERMLPCRDDLMSANQAPDTGWFQRTESSGAKDMTRLQNVGALGHYIELLDILSRIHRFLKTTVDISALPEVEQWQKQYLMLDSGLSSWRHALPSEYGNISRLFIPTLYQEPVDAMWITLQSMYYTTIIRLHSSAAYPATCSELFQPSFRASQRCISAVDNICALCSYVTDKDMLSRLGPPFAFTLWVAARVLLVAGSIATRLNPAVNALVAALRQIGVQWRVAERYATLLQRVLDEYQETHLSPDATRETSSSLRIVADMRRCAYDLEYLISNQPASRVPGGAPIHKHTPNTEDLMSFDTFEFFNMPRLAVNLPSEDALHLNMPVSAFEYTMENSNWNDWLQQYNMPTV